MVIGPHATYATTHVLTLGLKPSPAQEEQATLSNKMPMFGNTPMMSALSHPSMAPHHTPQSVLPTLLPTTPYVSAQQVHKDMAAPRHVVSIKQFDRNRLH